MVTLETLDLIAREVAKEAVSTCSHFLYKRSYSVLLCPIFVFIFFSLNLDLFQLSFILNNFLETELVPK